LEALHEQYPNQINILEHNQENERDIYAISDAIIFMENDDIKIKNTLSY
jgi:hypothetical protein